MTDPVVRTWKSHFFLPWSPAKPSSWRKHCYGRMLVFEGFSILNAQVPSLPILFVCCVMVQWLQSSCCRSCLPHHPLNSPLSRRSPACPNSSWRIREIFWKFGSSEVLESAFARFFWAGRWSARSWVKFSMSCPKGMNLLCSYLGSLEQELN